MGLVRTDDWLLNNREETFELLRPFFNESSVEEIEAHLQQFGMLSPSYKALDEIVKSLQKNQFWSLLEEEFITLRELWNGPDIPIFIFPSNIQNEQLVEKYNGLSGLAFKDKLFIFLSKHNNPLDAKILLTHEYHHVCRLNKYDKKEDDYTLLDTIILEGLAEYAVLERFDEDALKSWLIDYDDDTLHEMYEKYIARHINVSKNVFLHDVLLYGLEASLPPMVGYAVGFYLVKTYMNQYQTNSFEVIGTDSKIIAQIID